MPIPRWDTGGGGGSGVVDRDDSGPDTGGSSSSGGGSSGGGSSSSGGGGGSNDDHIPDRYDDYGGPDTDTTDDDPHTDLNDSSGMNDPDNGQSGPDFAGEVGGIPFREGGPVDPDVGTSVEDDDTAPPGTAANPIDPIDNPSRYGYESALHYLAQHYPNHNALETVAASLGRDPNSYAPTDGDGSNDVNAGDGGGGVDEGDDAVVEDNGDGTSGPRPTGPDDGSGGSSGGGGDGSDTPSPTEAADAASSWLEENSDMLGALGAVATVGATAIALRRGN